MSGRLGLSSLRRLGLIVRQTWGGSERVACLLHETRRNYSDAVKPKVSNNEGPKLDPFGIEEDLSLEGAKEGGKKVVSGFYQHDYQTKEQSQGDDKLTKYEEWFKAREDIQIRTIKKTGAESARSASYGNVRLDGDNLVEEDGQFDDPSHHDPLKSKYYQQVRQRQEEEEEEEETGSYNSNTLTAANFLKKMKEQKKQELKTLKEQPKDIVIDKPIIIKRKTKMEQEEDKFTDILESQLQQAGSDHVPKIYQLPNYNGMTHTDMWSLLKTTVIFQNEYLMAINKPPGISIHSPSIDCRHYIIQFLSEFAKLVKCDAIYPLHRLDKETTGVLLFAKEERMGKFIKEKFAQRQIEKRYLVVTKECPNIEQGTIKIPIGEGKVGGTDKYRSTLKPDLRRFGIPTGQKGCREAITKFKVISSRSHAAFLEVNNITGLKHQIRLHLGLGLGCPVIGDHKYSHRDKMAPQRLHPHLLNLIKVKQSKVREIPLHLHSNAIEFTLPEGATESKEPIYIHANVPPYFKYTLTRLGLK